MGGSGCRDDSRRAGGSLGKSARKLRHVQALRRPSVIAANGTSRHFHPCVDVGTTWPAQAFFTTHGAGSRLVPRVVTARCSEAAQLLPSISHSWDYLGLTPRKRQRKRKAGKSQPPPAVSSPTGWGKTSGKSNSKSSKGGGKGGGGKSGKSSKAGGSPPMPAHELESIMQALQDPRYSKVCRFYNSSRGCSLGDGCKFTHKCCSCGGGHPMVGNH